jgi:hypothetical protein
VFTGNRTHEIQRHHHRLFERQRLQQVQQVIQANVGRLGPGAGALVPGRPGQLTLGSTDVSVCSTARLGGGSGWRPALLVLVRWELAAAECLVRVRRDDDLVNCSVPLAVVMFTPSASRLIACTGLFRRLS